jgi:hypothetical protein
MRNSFRLLSRFRQSHAADAALAQTRGYKQLMDVQTGKKLLRFKKGGEFLYFLPGLHVVPEGL